MVSFWTQNSFIESSAFISYNKQTIEISTPVQKQSTNGGDINIQCTIKIPSIDLNKMEKQNWKSNWFEKYTEVYFGHHYYLQNSVSYTPPISGKLLFISTSA